MQEWLYRIGLLLVKHFPDLYMQKYYRILTELPFEKHELLFHIAYLILELTLNYYTLGHNLEIYQWLFAKFQLLFYTPPLSEVPHQDYYSESKFSQAFGASSSDSSSDLNVKVSTVSTNNCSSTSGGTGSWSKDGGTVSYSAYNAWKLEDLPSDLKMYALDPTSVGLTFKSSSGWNAIAYSGGQCTDLTASLMYALWDKNGSHPTMTNGNGDSVAKNWASSFGGNTNAKPSSGAVFSQTASSAGNSAGHTGLVSHVFENGDILVIKQNYSSLSGEDGGFGQYTWSYRYVPTSQYSSGWTFYDLSQAGYSIVSTASSLD